METSSNVRVVDQQCQENERIVVNLRSPITNDLIGPPTQQKVKTTTPTTTTTTTTKTGTGMTPATATTKPAHGDSNKSTLVEGKEHGHNQSVATAVTKDDGDEDRQDLPRQSRDKSMRATEKTVTATARTTVSTTTIEQEQREKHLRLLQSLAPSTTISTTANSAAIDTVCNNNRTTTTTAASSASFRSLKNDTYMPPQHRRMQRRNSQTSHMMFRSLPTLPISTPDSPPPRRYQRRNSVIESMMYGNNNNNNHSAPSLPSSMPMIQRNQQPLSAPNPKRVRLLQTNLLLSSTPLYGHHDSQRVSTNATAVIANATSVMASDALGVTQSNNDRTNKKDKKDRMQLWQQQEQEQQQQQQQSSVRRWTGSTYEAQSESIHKRKRRDAVA